MDDNEDEDNLEGNDEGWLKQLENIVCGNKQGKPEILYNMLIEKITNEDGTLSMDIPNKSIVKKKISYLKSRYKKRAMKSII